MTEHPDDETFERFVEGELDEPTSAALEAHVVSCATCAARLERAARLELAMYELGAQLVGGAPASSEAPTADGALAAAEESRAATEGPPLVAQYGPPEVAARSPMPTPREATATAGSPARRRIPAAAAVAALAAAVVLVVVRGGAPTPTASREIPQVVCPVPGDEAACVARARVHGLVVAYPASTPPPLGTRRDDGLEHGPSTSPFAGASPW